MGVRSLYREPEVRAVAEPAALELHDVFRIYRAGGVETVALRGLSLRVEKREVVAVFGPSGSGKSTFMHLAAGLDVPSAGEVRVFGRSLSRMDDDELAGCRARDIAIVFQSDNLWPALSATENIAGSLRMAGVREPVREAAHSLEFFGLKARGRHRASALSGGEQQRVAIAAAAARRAGLVLADEPTGELDQANEARVLEGLLALRDDYDSTVIVVTHSARVAEAVDRVIEIRDGRVSE